MEERNEEKEAMTEHHEKAEEGPVGKIRKTTRWRVSENGE